MCSQPFVFPCLGQGEDCILKIPLLRNLLLGTLILIFNPEFEIYERDSLRYVA